MATSEVKGDQEVLTEVPDELKKLAKYVMRGFYPIEHVLIVDLLVRNVIMKDDDLAELLKFDKKQLRIMLNKLKSDKLLRSTLRVETQADGKTNRHNYYFINYKVFVNVIKYKLDKMRQKIESRERESTNKALYRCLNCDRQYSEYDAHDLMDFMTGEMKCTLCGAEVQEDETTAPEKDSFMQIALFNEQMRPLYEILKEVEHIKLSPDVLEPTPRAMADAARLKQSNGQYRGPSGWSESSKPAYDLYNQEVTINLGADSNKPSAKKEAKARPSWMSHSTVDGAIVETDAAVTPDAKPTTLSKTKSQDQGEIMKALLVHERKSAAQVHVPSAALSDNESDESASEDEFPESSMGIRDPGIFGKRKFPEQKKRNVVQRMEVEQQHIAEETEEEEEEEEEEVMVSVKGQMVALSEVTEHHVAEMEPREKQEYIKLAQEAYAAMHD